MTLTRAILIFKNINAEEIGDDEKISAIETVLNMPTHNSISKLDMLRVIKYLVQKHVPKKPKKIEEDYINGKLEVFYECASCGNPYTDDSFCSCCGQALDWVKHERYIIDEREIELLERYEGTMAQKKDPHRYDTFSKEVLADFCLIKDRSNDLFFRRYQAAKEIIDLIAKQVGINPDDTSFWLYSPEVDGTTPIVKRMEEWFSRSGEKAQLKRRLQELEQENSFLKSLIYIGSDKK